MGQALIRHPDSPRGGVDRIEANVARHKAGALALCFTVSGEIAKLALPALKAPARADELWQSTCFEAFIRSPSDKVYYEFNFAPSGEWAAYRFDGYRRAMTVAYEIDPPKIEIKSNGQSFMLEASLALDEANMNLESPLELGLSAVIEEADGAKSYWALNHPPGAPDFHHGDCFALQIATNKYQ